MSTVATSHWSEVLNRLGACYDAKQWAQQQETAEIAWATCPRGDWMLWLLGKTVGPPDSDTRRKLVGCLADVAEQVLHIFEAKYPSDQRPRLAIQACRDYASGKINHTECRPAYAAASAAAYAADAVAAAAYAAASAAAYAAVAAAVAAVAYADAYAAVAAAVAAAAYADAAAADAAAASAAYAASAYAAYAADAAYAAYARTASQLRSADIIRTHYPLVPIVSENLSDH